MRIQVSILFLMLLLVVVTVALNQIQRKEKAWIYKHRENGAILYCDKRQATYTDYIFLGSGMFKASQIETCYLK